MHAMQQKRAHRFAASWTGVSSLLGLSYPALTWLVAGSAELTA